MNVVLVTCDQWRADALSCAGHPVVRTPALDRLAAEGVRFASHFGQSAPCSPGRASLYTGMYQMNTRVCTNQTPLDGRHTNFAKELRTQGYEPVLVGYTDISADPRGVSEADQAQHIFGTLQGLESIEPMPRAPTVGWAAWLEELGYDVPCEMFAPNEEGDMYQRGTYPSVVHEGGIAGDITQYTTVNANGGAQFCHAVDAQGVAAAAFHKSEHSDGAYAVDLAMRHIRGRHGAPWAAHLSFFKPPPPGLASAPFHSEYTTAAAAAVPVVRAAGDGSLEAERAVHPFMHHILGGASDTHAARVAPADADELNLLRSQYWATCAETDAQLGRLFDFLRERGEWERTVVIFTADHAEQLGDHWLLSKIGFRE
jgi:arylsulfatase A-like enzyme